MRHLTRPIKPLDTNGILTKIPHMNTNRTQFSLLHPASKTSSRRAVRFCVAAALGITFGAVSATHAQISTIDSVVVTTNITPPGYDGLSDQVLTEVLNYPSVISFVVTKAGSTNTISSAVQECWQFATNGGSGAYHFQSNDSFTITMTVTLTGDPILPRKEAGFAVNDVAGGIEDGQYILDLDQHEVVAFGFPNIFYATPVNKFYQSGEPINMGITVFTDSSGQQEIIFMADGFSSPPEKVIPTLTGYTLGGYFQIQGAGTGPTNMGSATFDNITLTPLPTDLGVAGTQISQVVSITGTQLTQGVETNNGKTTKTKAPTKTTITTADILEYLAQDEHTAGTYSATNFPSGAKLLYTANSGLQVVEKNNTPLVNVANILSLLTAGQNGITSGTFGDTTGSTTPPFTQTDVRLVTLSYDATSVGGTRKFAVTGTGSSETTTAKPGAKGNYTETDSFSLQNGTGEGVNGEGVSVILSAFTVTASGTASLAN